jgi:hypothetical protein
MTSASAILLLSACGQGMAAPGDSGTSSATGGPAGAAVKPLPPGVISPARACRLVAGRGPRGFFTDIKRVHLVLTSYAKGEPVESEGDISTGLPPGALVWVVEVHAKAIHWDHSEPTNAQSPARPDTDYSVVMDARTGTATDFGECRCWPLPLWKVGTVVSLPPGC